MKFPKLKGKAILSPMAGVTDVAFRTIAKKYGAALTYTEFVSSAALVRNSKKTFEMITTHPTEKPVAVQLFGNDIEEVVESARLIQDKFDIMDVNCGCPAWKVIRSGAGSEMLKEPKQIGKFLEKLSTNLEKPVTVKIRTGIDDAHINAIEVAKIAEESGAAAIAIHGRTQKQGYSGNSNWEIIKKVKETVKIPVIGNGDVFTPEDFKEKLEYSGADYIMIARGAMTNPAIFKQIEDYMKKGTYEEIEKKKLFLEYLQEAKKYPHISQGDVKGQAVQFTKGIRNGAELRKDISIAKTVEEIEKLFRNFKTL